MTAEQDYSLEPADVVHFAVGAAAGVAFRINRSVAYLIMGAYSIYNSVKHIVYSFDLGWWLRGFAAFTLGFALAYLMAGEVK